MRPFDRSARETGRGPRRTARLLAVLLTAGACAAGRNAPPPRGPPHLEAEADLIRVGGGCYDMGAGLDDCDATPDERPEHRVCVRTFYIGRFEVTRGQWRAEMGSPPPSDGTCETDDCPAVDVGWAEVQEFIARLNARGDAHGRFRLPTEAEWEYAARSRGREEKFAGGGEVGRVAWYAYNSRDATHPVGTRAPNGLGLYDMTGNAWELVGDWFDERYYASSPIDDPEGPPAGVDRVVRGGGRGDRPATLRTTERGKLADKTHGTGHGAAVGFRLVLDTRTRAPRDVR